VCGEVDHEAVRVDATPAAALVHFAGGVGRLKLDAHDYFLPLAHLANVLNLGRRTAGTAPPLLSCFGPVRDLLLSAKYLFVAARNRRPRV
jgi:hypothetical protein